MKIHFTIFIVLISSIITYGQINNNDKLKEIISDYEEYPFKSHQFNLSLSESPINIKTNHIIIDNPFGDTYPLSYSIILNDYLISLFESGQFVCHNIEDFERDLDFEKRLNTKKFKYHWLFNNRLHALSGSTVYVWENSKWSKADLKTPLKKQPKLFEDNEFIVFNDCHGEWGGTVYFFDKETKNIYSTESSCANTVIKENDNYLVLAHLGHGFGFTELKSIPNPRMLTMAKKSEINKLKDGEALGYKDKTEAYKKIFDVQGFQLFSTFFYNERQIFIVNLLELTFLAEIIGNDIQIVHPLFGNNMYTHEPITNKYGNYILINLDYYGTALEKEVSVIVIKGNELTKIDWNKNHSH